MYIFISNGTWFEKKSKCIFIDVFKLVGKKWLNFVQMTNFLTV